MTGRFEDLTGKRFNFLTVESRAPSTPKGNGKKRTMWNCICDCGNKTIVPASKLKANKTKSCGCQQPKFTSNRLLNDLTGKKFGRLAVISRAEDHVRPNGRADTMWKCICDCGTKCIKRSEYLTKSKIPSCGCYRSEVTSIRKSIDLVGQIFGELTVVERIGTKRTSGNNPKALYLCRCSCGNFTEGTADALKNGCKKSCGCIKSFGESQVESILQSKGIKFKREFTFDDLVSSKGYRLRFDFAVFRNNEVAFLIEFQGVQHYMAQASNDSFGKQQREQTDRQKKEYCLQYNIPLYEIRYDQPIDETIEQILAMHVNSVPSAGITCEGVTTIPEGST